MLWPLTVLSVVLVANTNGRLAIPALAGLLVNINVGLFAVTERRCTQTQLVLPFIRYIS